MSQSMDFTHPAPSPSANGKGAADRSTLIAQARDSIVRGSKSFALASRLFDRATRERAWLLYAWCRKCDDIADGQDHGGTMHGVADGQARLSTIRVLTSAALRGEPTGDPAFDGFGLVMRECAIPERYAHDLIEGFALDAREWRPRSEADMLRYCYHVAGTVGCMMAILMGVDSGDEATIWASLSSSPTSPATSARMRPPTAATCRKNGWSKWISRPASI